MAWQMPAAAGQWTAAMGMPPDMNMASYTPEQWAVMQQQNWQQWTQWQQQYSQWQTQYGDKYAQHLQTGQPLAGMPPLPMGAVAPPAPPPPDQPPPPPPPHENNQPLFGNNQNQVSLVSTTQRNTSNYSNTKSTTGSNQWSYGIDAQKQVLSTVNSDALNKLAEEEKSFDIQFQKWEEEIERWRKENVNHPDKQSYREYEERFELCRAQLLERRQQMQMKRARLLNNQPQASNPPPGNKPTPVPPPLSNTAQNNYKGVQSQNYKNNTYQQDFNPPSSHSQPVPRSNNKNIDPQDRYESYHNIDDVKDPVPDSYPGAKSDPTTFLPTSSSSKSIPGLDLVPESLSNKIQDVIDITDDTTEMQQAPPDYSKISKGINNILGDAKIMNILSMVKNVPQAAGQNVPPNAPNTHYPDSQNYPLNRGNVNSNNFDQDQSYSNRQNMPYNKQAPDFPMRQNQGLNSQYSQQQGSYNDDVEEIQDQYDDRNVPYGDPNNQGGPGMRQGGPGMRQGGFDMRQGGNMRPVAPDMRQGGPGMRFGSPDMRLGGPSIRQGGLNIRQGGLDIRPGGPNMRQGGPDIRPSGPNMGQAGPEIRQGGPDMRQGGVNMRYGGPDMRQSGSEMIQDGPNMRPRGPDMNQSGPNMQQNLLQDMRRPSHGNQASQSQFSNNGAIPSLLSLNNRPPLQDMVNQQNVDDYYGPEQPMGNNNPIINQPPRPKWVEEPLFTPSLVVDYEHKPLRLKARDFIEPVHTFDYNHKSKDEDLNKKKDFEKEVEELFTRKPRREEPAERYVKDLYYRDYERRVPREEVRDIRDARVDYRDVREDYRAMRGPPRDAPREDFERRRVEDRFDDRRRDDTRDFRRDERRDERRDDRDRFQRRDDFRERERDRDIYRSPRDDRSRDMRRDDHRIRSRSKEIETRKRTLSKETEVFTVSKKSKDTKDADKKHVVMIDDILEPPGRDMRPEKIVIILRGLPGSGKSYLAKLIRDREAEHGGTARIMSIDDYFMQEGETEEKDPQTGKIVKKPFLKYEYDEASEESYMTSLKRAFKRSLTDGYFSFLIYDAVNDQLKHYADIWNFARQNGFQVYICTMEQDVQTCFKRNIHNRSLTDIEVLKARFFDTPPHHIQLDATTLLQSASITEVQMEDVEDDVIMEDVQEEEVESVFTSKWEKMDDALQLARLDGTSKPLRPSQLSMEDYLQLDDWKPKTGKSNKKTVRWADIEERREQEKMRAIGFVVGQTDWNRMTDLSMGSGALTQTKYIERVRRF